MKDIINYAIKNGEINKDMLIAMVNQMDDEMAVRFTNAILGIVVPEEITIPEVKNIYGHNNCRLKRYNYLFDRVEYEYGEQETRWFADEVSAKRFAENGFGYYNGEKEPKEGHEFEASYIFIYNSECPLRVWMEAK